MTTPSRYSEVGLRNKISQTSFAGDFQSPLTVNMAKGIVPAPLGFPSVTFSRDYR